MERLYNLAKSVLEFLSLESEKEKKWLKIKILSLGELELRLRDIYMDYSTTTLKIHFEEILHSEEMWPIFYF